MKTLSFIIPCYASEESVTAVINEIKNKMAERTELDYEIVAVNDCSPDNVLYVLKELAKEEKRIKVIDLAKNGGRHNALICGCHYVQGDYIVFVDDDMQCPVDCLWALLEPIEQGKADVSFARYSKKKQTIIKNIGSVVNDIVSNWLLEKDTQLKFSNFCAMREFVKDEIIRYQNPYPYMSGLMIRTTDKVVNVDMEERERTIGVGHYTFKKSVALWLNNFTAFSVKPLRFATMCGITTSIIGFLWSIYTVIRKLIVPGIAVGYSSLMAVLLFVGGLIMFMLGLIGEYIGRIYISLNSSPQYVIRETINLDGRG